MRTKSSIVDKLMYEFAQKAQAAYPQYETYKMGYQLMSKTASQEEIDTVKKCFPGVPIYFIEDHPELFE